MAEIWKDRKSRILMEVDRKAARVFKALVNGPLDGAKGEKAGRQFRVVRDRVFDEGFGKTLDGLFQDLSRPMALRRKPDADERW